jgi:hypothetical protein
MATNMTPLAPLNLAGLLFGDPCPLRWLPADARRMPRADSAAGASTPALGVVARSGSAVLRALVEAEASQDRGHTADRKRGGYSRPHDIL